MNNDTEIINLDGWTIRLRRPEELQSKPIMLLLHGWTGNEDVMWIFAQRFPKDRWILSPRGSFSAPEGGFGWLEDRGPFPTLEEFKPSVDTLLAMIDHWAEQEGVNSSVLDVMGFSQGGALTYAAALLYPQRIRRLASLASFMPSKIEGVVGKVLQEKPVYVAHGATDDTVPVERGREAVHWLENAGAQVTYCESDVGHKLSLSCLKGLEAFFE